jgi:ATP synthase protein I
VVSGGGTQPSRRVPGGPGGSGSRGDGWAAVSYLLGGMIVYGGIGWLLGHWAFHSALFFPLGMVVGLALSIVLIVFRFGRS